ncbi:MAG: DNA repair protein RecN [Actinobacteria bacterium]|uniref:DNA repair protein RecN n=1 Tax=freshwater metagenome TaxID=449393 RepID=A0A6J5YMB5_9ZZZZ|nr:DNA repair protein RecN [Actinomycetota bacterium]
MIEQVRIRNLGVINEATLDLSPGFNVLTGETGTGKTMVFRGLNLAFGGKAEATVVSHGSTQAVVEVDAILTEEVAQVVTELGGEIEQGNVTIISRQINSTGRSRSFVGGVSVPAAAVSDIGDQLVAVHGQSEQLRLTKASQQRLILDRFGGETVSPVLRGYQEVWTKVLALRSRIELLSSDSASRERELERIRKVVELFDSLKPQPGEDRELDDESKRLANSEALHSAAMAAETSLVGDDNDSSGTISLLATGRKALEREMSHDPAIEAIAQRMRELEVLMSDVSADVSNYLHSIDASPERLEYVESRRAALRSASREFGDVDALIAWVDENRTRMDELAGGDEVIEALRQELEIEIAQLRIWADKLSAIRTSAAATFTSQVTGELEGLAMPGARVEFVIDATEPGPHGADDIKLGLVSRPNAPWVPIAKGASGGELSRIMLAVEVVLAAADPIDTFIFDEVDAGVGGAAAVEIGRRLAQLGKTAQVIVVTHLPQVAAFADRHLVVSRMDDEEVHNSAIREVRDQDRVQELARMLAGLSDSQAGTSLAQELLDLAQQSR